MWRSICAAVFLLLTLAHPASAQTPPPPYNVYLFADDGHAADSPTNALAAYSLDPTTVQCGLRPKVPGGPVQVVPFDGTTRWLVWDDPADPTADCKAPVTSILDAQPGCSSAPCTVYRVVLGMVYVPEPSAPAATAVTLSPEFVLVAKAVPAQTPSTDPRCTPPLGDRVVNVFLNKYHKTTGNPGSRSWVEFQLASPNSPIMQTVVRLNGQPAAHGTMTARDGDISQLAGSWFDLPTAAGDYALTVEATNQYGCTAVSSKDAAGKPVVITITAAGGE